MSQSAYSAAHGACDSLALGEFVLRLTSKDPRPRTDESVAHAREARERGARFFQLYLPLGDRPLERWLGEQTPLVRAVEAQGWSLDDIGYVGEPLRDSFYRVVATSGKTVAVIYTFRAAGVMRGRTGTTVANGAG